MAEALAAVGVAASILQIIDFGTKVIKCTYNLMTAPVHELKKEIRLEELLKEQGNLAARYCSSLNRRSILSANEQAAVNLAGEVRTETESLLLWLESFKKEALPDITAETTVSEFTKKTFRSVKTAFTIERTRKEVETRRKSLQFVNGQLATALLLVLSEQSEKKSHAILDLQQSLEDKTKNIVDAIIQLRNELTACFNKHENRRQKRIQQIISSLHFPDMQSRRVSIDEAFPQTYEWALEQDISGLKTWMRTGSGIYWVAGKAGSGKSTLMKFLGNDNRTLEHLSEWSGSREDLIRVECYFWYLGSSLQRSVEGLLRTILHQILSACPDVVKTLLPGRWAQTEHNYATQPPWELKELQTVLQDVTEAISQANTLAGLHRVSKCCILVDGLDEYSGNHGELVQVLEKLASDQHTKLCVSSRPWNVFVRAFESRKPHLYLQALTEIDMRIYIDGKIRHAASLPQLSLDKASAHSEWDIVSITNEILCRAEGVFLWVRLAVQSVLRGLDEGDNIATLRKRVLEYPSDLDKFFDCMLARIDSVYQYQTSQALYLAYLYAGDHDRAATQSSYLDFELLGQDHAGLQDVQCLSALEPQALSLDRIMSLVYKTRSFLGACCKDLLSLAIPSDHTLRMCAEDPTQLQVQFIHRTVYEYIRATGYDRLLEQRVPTCFRDESVFHILNLGKLRYYWDVSPPASSPYFTRLVSSALDHGWKGVDVHFIDGLQSCQPFHQQAWAASIPAAYIALGQHDKFQTIYLQDGASRSPFEGLCPFQYLTFSPICRDYIDETSSTESSRDPDVGKSLSKELIASGSIGDGTYTYLQLLAAALGIAACRPFPCEMIDLNTLSNILKLGPELTLFEQSDAEDSEAVQFVLGRFLETALEPLLGASIEASKDYLQWCAFVASNRLHHTHDVMGLLMQKHSDDLTHTIKTKLPSSETDRYETLWRLLTITTFTESTKQSFDVLHSPEEWKIWQEGSLGQSRLQAVASSFDWDGSRCNEKQNDSNVVGRPSRPDKRLARRDDDDDYAMLQMAHPLHRTQLPIHLVCTKEADSQALRSCGSQALEEPPRKRAKRRA